MSGKDYPILGIHVIPEPVEAPRPVGAALYYTARWQVWRINGVPMLYERRPYKVRSQAKARPQVHHHDTVLIGPLSEARTDCGIDLATLADARAAVEEHRRGIV